MFLVDTNIFLEVMLGQEKAAEVKDFFNRADFSSLFVSDFSLFSIGIIYFREKNPGPFIKLVNEDMGMSGLRVASLDLPDYPRIVKCANEYHLDFDDAYQYAVAERHDLTIVSFDHGFDKTKKGRVLPMDIFREK
ncbi:MAG: PIN domain-containing protein [Methanoregula sp.]|nr:PIN domain-containing protein [Methanoregula sp.]MDP2796117.1 PIN domain-containing protein [Methanoregula sp.]